MERDIDPVSCLARDGLKRVEFSVITLNASLAHKLELSAPSLKRYLIMIELLSKVCIPVRIMAFSLIPGLLDHEIEGILEPGKDADAKSMSWMSLTGLYSIRASRFAPLQSGAIPQISAWRQPEMPPMVAPGSRPVDEAGARATPL